MDKETWLDEMSVSGAAIIKNSSPQSVRLSSTTALSVNSFCKLYRVKAANVFQKAKSQFLPALIVFWKTNSSFFGQDSRKQLL